jgi:hypothetical protein
VVVELWGGWSLGLKCGVKALSGGRQSVVIYGIVSRFIALLSVLLVDTIVQLLDICEINGCPK